MKTCNNCGAILESVKEKRHNVCIPHCRGAAATARRL